MNRQREAARTAALFLSFTAFFMTSPLTLWDAGLFAQISASRAVEVSVINGLAAMGTALAIGAGLWSMTRESPRVGPAVAVTGERRISRAAWLTWSCRRSRCRLVRRLSARLGLRWVLGR